MSILNALRRRRRPREWRLISLDDRTGGDVAIEHWRCGHCFGHINLYTDADRRGARKSLALLELNHADCRERVYGIDDGRSIHTGQRCKDCNV